MLQRKKLSDQLPFLQKTDIAIYHLQLLDDLFQDFIDVVHNQQTEAKQQNRTVHTIIRNVDDFVKLVNLQLALMDHMPIKFNRKREQETRLNDSIKAEPEEQHQIIELLENLQSIKTRGEIDGGGQ